MRRGNIIKKVLTTVLSLSLVGVGSISAVTASAAVTDPAGTVVINGPTNAGGYDLKTTIESTNGIFTIKDGTNWAISSLPKEEEAALGGVSTGSANIMGTGTARWTPNEGVLNGKYAVYVYNVKRTDACDVNVDVVVASDNGLQTMNISQENASGEKSGWAYICTADFDSAADYVEVNIKTSGVYTHIKDVKFVPVTSTTIVTPWSAAADGTVDGVTNGRISAPNYGASTNTSVVIPSSEVIESLNGNVPAHYYVSSMPEQPVTFRPELPGEGKYKVYIWQTFHKDNASTAYVDVSVNHSGGTDTSSEIPYRANVPRWMEVGEYVFAADGTETIEVTTTATTSDFRVGAIKFEGVPVNADNTDIKSITITADDGSDVTIEKPVKGADGTISYDAYVSKTASEIEVTAEALNSTAEVMVNGSTNTARFTVAKTPKVTVKVSAAGSESTYVVNVYMVGDPMLMYVYRNGDGEAAVAGGVINSVTTNEEPWGVSDNSTVIIHSPEVQVLGMETMPHYYGHIGDTISYRPRLMEAGTYKVYIWQTYHKEYLNYQKGIVDAVSAVISHNGKIDTVNGIPYSDNPARWAEIGTFDFNASGRETITITADDDTATNDDFRAAELKLVPITVPESENPTFEIRKNGTAVNDITAGDYTGAAANMDKNAVVILAKYAKDGEFVGCSMATENTGGKIETATLTVTDEDVSNGCELKLFVWEDMVHIQPLGECVKRTVNN